ncbi:MAG: M10 family metallopeptidase C-terminal domain-containing protein, partial [Hyphomicrobium sp.]
GSDTMAGGTGNDTYVVDNATDVVTENSGAGTDTIQTILASYTLGSNLENLTFKGTGNFIGTGNSLSNMLTGGTGNDMLNGGAGADTHVGGLGNDTFVFDNAGDTAIELLGEGTDTVQSSVSIAGLGANTENLTLSGTATLNGTGNALNNTILGNSAANILSGLDGADSLSGGSGADTLDGGTGADSLNGGAGRDIMTGGADADTFIFNGITESGNSATTRDIITDFVHGVDKIDLSGMDASSSLAGNNSFLWIGTGAFSTSADGQIRYQYDATNNVTVIYGDTDTDTTSEFQIQLAGNITLTESDFLL